MTDQPKTNYCNSKLKCGGLHGTEKECKYFTPGESYRPGFCIYQNPKDRWCINPKANKEAME